MPGLDGTGPEGRGAMTGGGRGFCAEPVNSIYGRPRMGRSFSRGGRGRRNMYYATGLTRWQRNSGTAAGEKEELTRELEILRNEMENIQLRINELDKSEKDRTEG